MALIFYPDEKTNSIPFAVFSLTSSGRTLIAYVGTNKSSHQALSDTMRINSFALALAFAANINYGAVAFLVGPDGNNDLMKNAVENALQTDIKPLVDTDSGAFPPLRNQILGTEVPVRRGAN